MNDDASGPAESGPSHRIVDVAVAIAFVAIGAVVMWDSRRIGAGWASDGPQAGYFPFYIGLVMTAASLVNVYRAFANREGQTFVEWSKLGLVVQVLAPTIVFVALIPWLGMYVSAALFIAFFMRWMSEYSWPLIAAVAIGVPVVMFLTFELWFLVALPKGPLEAAVGY